MQPASAADETFALASLSACSKKNVESSCSLDLETSDGTEEPLMDGMEDSDNEKSLGFEHRVKTLLVQHRSLVVAAKDLMVMMKSLFSSIIVFYFLDVQHMVVCSDVVGVGYYGTESDSRRSTVSAHVYRDVQDTCTPQLDYSTSKRMFLGLVCANQLTYAMLISCRHKLLFKRRSRMVATISAGFACICALAKVSIVLYYALAPVQFACNAPASNYSSGATECYTRNARADLNKLLPGGCNASTNLISGRNPNYCPAVLQNPMLDGWAPAVTGSCCEPTFKCDNLCNRPDNVKIELILLAVSYILSGAYLVHLAMAYHTECKMCLKVPDTNDFAAKASKMVRRLLGDLASLAKFFIAFALILGIVAGVNDFTSSGILTTCSSATVQDIHGHAALIAGDSIKAVCEPNLPKGQLWYQACSTLLVLLAGLYSASIAVEKGQALRLEAWRVTYLWLALVTVVNVCLMGLFLGLDSFVSLAFNCKDDSTGNDDSTGPSSRYTCSWKKITHADLVQQQVPFDRVIGCNDQCSAQLPATLKILCVNLQFSALYFIGLMIKFAIESKKSAKS
jgi:hypothetical protein